MTEASRTRGEILFEQYLVSQSLPFEFEKEHAGKSKRPDYTIDWKGQTVVFDVKDFDPPERLPTGFGAYDPYTPIREKIDQGRDKFKQYKEHCCALVLHNAGRPLVSLDEPYIMLGAMYGDSGFTFPVNTSTGIGDSGKLRRAFLGRGKMLRPSRAQPQNTTISAVIAVGLIRPHFQRLLDLVDENPNREIADCESESHKRIADYDSALEVPRVIVWHNAVARIPFPDTLFRGTYDTHFGIVRSEEGKVNQKVTYEGSGVPYGLKLDKLREAS